MIVQPYDWKKKEVTKQDFLSKPVLDFTKWWIECRLEKLVAPTNGFTYRLIGFQSLRDERPRKISKETAKEREVPLEGVEARKEKEVA